MTDPDLSKFFPEAMQVLAATECKACLVVVVESADRGNGAAPAFAVPTGADGQARRARTRAAAEAHVRVPARHRQ